MLHIMHMRSIAGLDIYSFSDYPKDSTKKMTIDICNSLNDGRIALSTNSNILGTKSWKRNNVKTSKVGTKMFGCILHTESNKKNQTFYVNGDGFKTAYNNAMLNKNINVKHILVVFDANQKLSKKVATVESKKMLQTRNVSNIDKLVAQASQI